ncbi:MAG: hypothetical protein CL845_04705 [Crocinitomicaceae bacterium]|nr:hypothetical protein [Crocinitomicaceae bacterium]
MPSSEERSIGDRITYAWHENALTIIIRQRIPRSQQIVLEGWFFAWLCVGGATSMEMADATGSDRTFFLIFMAFWVFFAFRVLKVILWRRIGKEMVRITAEGMSVKNSFNNLGRARFFVKNNIKKMEVIQRDKTNFTQNLDQSFWIMGGDSLQFTYFRRHFVLGKQLDNKSAVKLAKLIDEGLRKF